MQAHHTSTGCNTRSGDLLGSGTISGETVWGGHCAFKCYRVPCTGLVLTRTILQDDSFASLIEMSWNGTKPFSVGGGATRCYMQDGDSITLTASATDAENGMRVGFGRCEGTLLPAHCM